MVLRRKEMKVYVYKGKLESHDIQSITDLGGKEFKQVRMWFKDTDNVEILSLTDYTKQVRKEVYQELKNKILYCSERIFEDGHYYYGKELDEIIGQIQGETK